MDTQQPDDLTPTPGRKDVAGTILLALASGLSYRAAARRAGCSDRTVRRYMARPEFRLKVADARRDMINRATGILAKGMAAASRKLRTLAKGAASEVVQLAAAKSVLELGSKLDAATTLAERVAEMEQMLGLPEKKP